MNGIGADIIEIERIKQAIEKIGEKFLARVYSIEERKYCESKINPYPSYAVRFAAKEAYIKYAGFQGSVKLTEIEVIKGERGKPGLRIKGAVDKSLYISLSHSKNNAIAVVAGG